MSRDAKATHQRRLNSSYSLRRFHDHRISQKILPLQPTETMTTCNEQSIQAGNDADSILQQQNILNATSTNNVRGQQDATRTGTKRCNNMKTTKRAQPTTRVNKSIAKTAPARKSTQNVEVNRANQMYKHKAESLNEWKDYGDDIDSW